MLVDERVLVLPASNLRAPGRHLSSKGLAAL